MLSSHIFKENNVLYPAALKVISEEEWSGIREDFDEIGYCCFTPQHLTRSIKTISDESHATLAGEKTLKFDTGSLSKEELEAILDTIPVDISFVDANDAVKYFNKADKRIFVRTKAVIGRKVQMCHPQKSVHIVNRIVDAFKLGQKNSAEFWISLNNRLVQIRYFCSQRQAWYISWNPRGNTRPDRSKENRGTKKATRLGNLSASGDS
jgi:hypothetical protein